MATLRYPLWQVYVETAIVECNHLKRQTAVVDAELIIANRLSQLGRMPSQDEERIALYDAQRILRGLRDGQPGDKGVPQFSNAVRAGYSASSTDLVNDPASATVEVENPAEFLRDEDGSFEVTSPYGHVFRVVCRRGATMNVRQIYEPRQPVTSPEVVWKILRLGGPTHHARPSISTRSEPMPAPRQIDPLSMSPEDQRFENALRAAYNFFQTRPVNDAATAEKYLIRSKA